ncbi:MAG: response regulator transcription factor [Candidatus Fermentibacterota bacterium]
MVPSRPSLMLVEDDQQLASLLREYLESHAMEVSHFTRGSQALERIDDIRPDLVVLDLMLPDMDGLDVCRSLRQRWRGQILMLTAMKDDADVVAGLETGADDYVGKPVSPRVLLARIRALLRRSGAAQSDELIRVGALEVRPQARRASWQGIDLDLTTTEFDLLEILAARAGRVQERAGLVRELRGIDFTSIDRSVDVIVSRLRRKLAAAGASRDLIRTVRGMGYMMAREEG